MMTAHSICSSTSTRGVAVHINSHITKAKITKLAKITRNVATILRS